MPTVLVWRGYRFYFYSNEGFEPPHIHVDKNGNSVKFWLQPITVARNHGFSQRELGVIESKIADEKEAFIEAWNGHFVDNR